MNGTARIQAAVTRAIGWTGLAGPVAELLTRLTLGMVFVHSGWGKLTHLDKAVEYFKSLGIPYPQLQAPFAAANELVCGALVLVGLATRFAALPLIAVMIVAIRTAKWGDISDLSSLLDVSEYLYIVLLLWLVARGGGKISLDHLLKSKMKNG